MFRVVCELQRDEESTIELFEMCFGSDLGKPGGDVEKRPKTHPEAQVATSAASDGTPGPVAETDCQSDA
jgi:hypothetical protein